MDQQTRDLFIGQLAHWAEALLDRERSPFRKVEVHPSLLTEKGELSPPLVFWINRESFMAGGVLLFPEVSGDGGRDTGQACSRALGLQHFVTWSSREIVFWNSSGENPSPHRTIALKGQASTAEFRKALTSVMAELKLLSVLGAVPPSQLSSHYLANLCLGALRAAVPFLEEARRAARGQTLPKERNHPDHSLESQADRKGMMTLVRLLALVFHDLLPANVQPGGLERAMRFSLDSLAPGVREGLNFSGEEPPLPPESAVRYHHLFRRLVQLRCGEDRQRAVQVLELLQDHSASSMGGFPLPFPPSSWGAGSTLLLNPDRPYPPGGELLEIAPKPILAFNALLRNLKGLPQARVQDDDPFALAPSPAPAVIKGTLAGNAPPQRGIRPTLTAMLRASWPTRRFALPARAPFWVWELLHLLGIATEGASLELALSDQWLTADFGLPIIDLLKEQFTLETLERSSGDRVRMRLIKGAIPEKVALFLGPDGPRQIHRERLGLEHRAFFPLALDLPAALFRLLEEGILQIPGEEKFSGEREEEIRLYLQSNLGRYLWKIVGGKPGTISRAGSLQRGVLRQGLPLPAGEILKDLGSLRAGGRSAEKEEIDKVLASRLGVDVHALIPTREFSGFRSISPSSLKTPSESDTAAMITREVFVDGLPLFPEQYLYDYYRPSLRDYAFSGPLTMADEFFGKFALRDGRGEVLQVDGSETARALLLVSHSGRTSVSLPEDRRLTATILERYLEDLELLRRDLARTTHIRISDPKAADALASRIWKSLSLPPWDLIST